MSGFVRDLGAVDPWDASLERSRARRERSRRVLSRRRGGFTQRPLARPRDPFGLGALLHEELAPRMRDLAAGEVWELSLGRSRARRRAAELRFVPGGTRAKRISLGALAALTAGPAAALATGGGQAVAATGGPATTTEHDISIGSESQGQQVEHQADMLGVVLGNAGTLRIVEAQIDLRARLTLLGQIACRLLCLCRWL